MLPRCVLQDPERSRRSHRHPVAVSMVLLLVLRCVCGASPPGLKPCLEPGLLPMPVDAPVRMVGTTGRSGPGEDYVLLKPGETATVLVLEGPAVIHRIWSTSQFTDRTRLTLKLDGKERVLWEKAKLPPDAPADDPLRAMEGQAYWSYLPLEVKKKAAFIATDLRPRGAGGSAKVSEEGNKFYLQAAYSPGWAGVMSAEALQQLRTRLRRYARNPLSDLAAPGSSEHQGTPTPVIEGLTVAQGSWARVRGDEHWVVECMSIDASGVDFETLKATRLVMRSDGSDKPCVDVPVPYLFALYWEPVEFTAPLLACKDGKLTLRLPIPVGRGLEVSLAPMGSNGTPSLFVQLRRSYWKQPPAYRFCAEYRSMVSKPGEPLHLGERYGEGLFVGCTFAADGLERLRFTFLEGNEQIFTDGGTKPTWEGTGTEDFFNAAWYFSSGVNAGAFHGLTYLSEGPPPRMSAYRFLIPDRIAFSQGLRFDMQHGSRNSSPNTYYQAVALYYQKPPCAVEPPVQAEIPVAKGPTSHAVTSAAAGGRSHGLVGTLLAVGCLLVAVAAVWYAMRGRRTK